MNKLAITLLNQQIILKTKFWCERSIAEPNDQVIWPHLQIKSQRRTQMTDYGEMQIYG